MEVAFEVEEEGREEESRLGEEGRVATRREEVVVEMVIRRSGRMRRFRTSWLSEEARRGSEAAAGARRHQDAVFHPAPTPFEEP